MEMMPSLHKGLIAGLVFLSSCGTRPVEKLERVEKEITRSVDVTGDGVEDQVTLRIRGDSFAAPFFWKLSIRSGGKEVFSYDGDGTGLTRFLRTTAMSLVARDT
jgi:hypothetical protein